VHREGAVYHDQRLWSIALDRCERSLQVTRMAHSEPADSHVRAACDRAERVRLENPCGIASPAQSRPRIVFHDRPD